MPQSPPSSGRFRTLARWAAISLALATAVWLVVIVWWQTTRRDVTTADLLLYLFALPLALLATLLLVGHYRKKRKNRALNADEASTAAVADESEKRATLPPLPVMAAWTATSLGVTADEFLAALVQQRIRPRPDSLLTDDRGFPLLCGRIKEIDTSLVEDRLALAVKDGRLPEPQQQPPWRDALLRALSLLGSVLDQALQNWPLQQTAAPAPHQASGTATLRGTSGLPDETIDIFQLQVKLLVSASLQPYEQQFARAYLEECLAPLQIPARQLQIELVPAHDDAAALALLDTFRAGTGERALLLLACDSMLCPTIADDWQASERLFDSSHPNGLMMGEAAFGVLCLDTGAMEHALTPPICHLLRMSRAQRKISADSAGRPTDACLNEQVEIVLKATDTAGDAIGTVICDADHRAGRTLECIDAMIAHTPKLDAIRDRFAINEACGHLGAASVPGMIAAAALQAAGTNHPTLLFNVSHPTDRAAALLLPDPIPPSPEDLQAA